MQVKKSINNGFGVLYWYAVFLTKGSSSKDTIGIPISSSHGKVRALKVLWPVGGVKASKM